MRIHIENLATLLLVAVVATVAFAQPAAPPAIPDVAGTINALVVHDWHLVVAGGIGLLGFVLRILVARERWPWLHTAAATATMMLVLAVGGAMVPLLSAHATWTACFTTGATAAVLALTGMINPSGPQTTTATPVPVIVPKVQP